MKVSVVIPTYNNECTIAATVESALAQRFDTGFEVIVVNDGSTDDTPAVLKQFGDRIHLIEQENRGASAARNAGIAAAAGEYIAFLDGDDTWTEDKLEKSVTELDQNSACVAAYSNVIEIDGAGRELSLYVTPECEHAPTLDEMLERVWPLIPSAIVIRRETLIATGGFSEDFGAGAWGGEDVLAFLLVRERGEIIFVPEKLVSYRTTEFAQRFTKRTRPMDTDRKSPGALADPERYFRGNSVWARLMLDRYGARGRKLADVAIDTTARELAMLGMMAMHEGDRGYARRCYRASIRYRPLWLKTYFRLGWAMLPSKVSDRLRPLLAPGIQRSLSGPPFSKLAESPAASRDS
jgi:glycosyltransferase involved in cell wall biosynthesis